MTKLSPSQKKKHGDRVRPLSRMQSRYIEEILANPSGTYTSAAIRAGYSMKSASITATNLNQNPVVAAAIALGRKKSMEKFDISKDRILQELCKVAFADLGETIQVSSEGIITVTPNTPTEVSIETNSKTGAVSRKFKTIKAADKVAALVQIGKQLGMFRDQVELSGKVSLVDLVEASFKETPA